MTKRGIHLLLSGSLALSAFPQGAFADEKTGIAAGLGVAAASGKTTMGDGAGSIETALLDSDSILEAGKTIYEISKAAKGTRDVLVLGRGDAIDYTMALWLKYRIGQLKTMAAKVPTCVPTIVPLTSSQIKSFNADVASAADATPKFGVARTDVIAALATDVSVGKITLGTEDLPLVNAVVMGANKNDWFAVSTPPKLPAAKSDYATLRSQQAFDPAGNAVLKDLSDLQDASDTLRACADAEHKAAVETIDKFVAGAVSAEKGPPAILAAARLPTNGWADLPFILEVAIEAHGGTSVTRSNVWYTLGFPGAAVVTSGLKASFVLRDPKDGSTIVSGIVRCVTKPTSYRDVSRMLVTTASEGPGSLGERQAALVTCSYRLG